MVFDDFIDRVEFGIFFTTKKPFDLFHHRGHICLSDTAPDPDLKHVLVAPSWH